MIRITISAPIKLEALTSQIESPSKTHQIVNRVKLMLNETHLGLCIALGLFFLLSCIYLNQAKVKKVWMVKHTDWLIDWFFSKARLKIFHSLQCSCSRDSTSCIRSVIMKFEQDKKYLSRQEGFELDKKDLSRQEGWADKKGLSRQKGFEQDQKYLSRIWAGHEGFEQDKKYLSRTRRIWAGQEGFEQDKKDLSRSRRIWAGKRNFSRQEGFEQDKRI